MWRSREQGEADLGVGDTLGPYRIEAMLGEGGMGRVFRAVREPDGEMVALKVMKSELAANEEYGRRFIREARAAKEVEHKHLVGILDAGEIDARRYLVMRYVDGRSLEQRIESEGALPVEDTIQLAAEVASALDALHSRGLVHRDVKASNIMLAEDGSAALADFGLAKGSDYSVLTQPGQVVGTLDYLAPEMIRGEKAGPQSDIYALGCVVFECLAGKPPFAGKGILQVGMAHLEEAPSDPCCQRADAPPSLSEAVLTALAKDPARRPPTATAYSTMLRVAGGASRI